MNTGGFPTAEVAKQGLIVIDSHGADGTNIDTNIARFAHLGIQ
jgi:hypothetical protein